MRNRHGSVICCILLCQQLQLSSPIRGKCRGSSKTWKRLTCRVGLRSFKSLEFTWALHLNIPGQSGRAFEYPNHIERLRDSGGKERGMREEWAARKSRRELALWFWKCGMYWPQMQYWALWQANVAEYMSSRELSVQTRSIWYWSASRLFSYKWPRTAVLENTTSPIHILPTSRALWVVNVHSWGYLNLPDGDSNLIPTPLRNFVADVSRQDANEMLQAAFALHTLFLRFDRFAFVWPNFIYFFLWN